MILLSDICTYVITTIMLQTSDYLDWLANGVNHSHPDFGGPGCYTFRSSAQWVRMSTSTCISLIKNEICAHAVLCSSFLLRLERPLQHLPWPSPSPPGLSTSIQQLLNKLSRPQILPGGGRLDWYTPLSSSVQFYSFTFPFLLQLFTPSLLLFHFINPSTETRPFFLYIRPPSFFYWN